MSGQNLAISRRVARKKGSAISSIFGQIEGAVATTMVTEGKLTLIAQEEIPESALYNDRGTIAMFAVVIPREYAAEFERRIRELRR